MDVVRRAQAGDREAFEALVERHAAETYRLAAAIVGVVDARDVTQEALLAAWQHLPRLRNPDAFDRWLRRICVTRCRNWLRGQRRDASSLGIEVAAEVPDTRADFGRAVEARTVLEPAFKRLSPEQRAVLALHYAIGFSIAETADVLDVRVGTVKSRLNAGLAVLRTAIAPGEANPEPEAAR
ncbi:MAG: RNA polymerase sigma factor [Candidatus Limnocylindria bacterium]